ncbi:MAG: TonB-dependent receptor [Bdellovibrionaceae bacterium]|nr:TonB-dependent receptor [Bdellovibrio sp.]
MKFFLISFGTILFFYQQASAVQDFETVVKETKFNSSSRIVIDKAEILKSRARNITTLLATQANITIVQSNFTPTSIFMRGGDGSHIQILVDGIPFYDSTTVQRTFDLNDLDIKSVQRIEVIKGSQSVIYGGQALVGVIKIDTIPKEIKSSGQVMAQAGNHNQFALNAGGLYAVNDQFGVLIRGSHSQKQARSPVLDSEQRYPTSLDSAELGLVYRDSVEAILKLQTSFDRTKISTTANPSFKAADADEFRTSTYMHAVTGILGASNIIMKPKLIVTNQLNARLFEQDVFASEGFPTKQDYIGKLFAARLEITPVESTHFNLKMGRTLNQERMIFNDADILSADKEIKYEGYFTKAEVIFSENWLLELGERLDFEPGRSTITTHQVGLSIYEMLRLEYSTGFKRPSLFQLYSSYGNPNLEPELSTTYSVSFEKNVTPNFYTSFSIFETYFKNLIMSRGFPPVYDTYNAKTQGVEVVTGYNIAPIGMNINLGIGYQEPKDLNQGAWLPRRPLKTASLKIRQEFNRIGLGLEIQHAGERRDRTGSTTYGNLKPYTLVHTTADFKATESVAVFARIQNLFNQRYESNYGFYDEGLNVMTGVEYSF